MKKLKFLGYLMVFIGLFFVSVLQNIPDVSNTGNVSAASGVITEFSDSTNPATKFTEKTVSIPPGGLDSSMAVKIPRDVVITEAKLNVTGGTGLNSLDLWNYENSCQCDDAVCIDANPGWVCCWNEVSNIDGVSGQILHMNVGSADINRRAISKWIFPDGITIEFLARGDATGDTADTVVGFYSDFNARNYWGFGLGVFDNIGVFYYDNGVHHPLINNDTLSISNNKWVNVEIKIDNGNFYAKTWDYGTIKPTTNQIERYWDAGTNKWVLQYQTYDNFNNPTGVWQTVVDPGGNDPNKKMMFGNRIMIGTNGGQHNEEFWFQAITAYDIQDFTIDVGPDGIVDWSNPSFIGTVPANFDTDIITDLIRSDTCANPVGSDCLLNLDLFTSSGGEITLDNLEIGWMTIEGGLVPCGRLFNDPGTSWDDRDDCTLCHLILMAQLIIEFLVKIAAVVAAFFLAIAGFIYIFAAGQPDKMALAKKTFTSALLGFLLIFIAWIMVDTILTMFGYIDPLGDGNWHIMC